MRVLFFTWAYPPLKYPRAIQVSRLVKYSRHAIRVVCGMDGSRLDESLAANDGGRAVEVMRFDIRHPRWRGRVADLLDGSYCCEKLELPDHYLPWALRTAGQVLRRAVIGADEVLVTFAQPMSDHLAGLRLSRALGVPWIAHFSDPWTDNPFVDQGAWVRALNRRMERAVIAAADRVVFTSQQTLELVMAKYPADWRQRAHVLPHCFDPDQYGGGIPASPRLIFRYLGGFYKDRSPLPLLDALHVLQRRAPELLSAVQFEFVGSGMAGAPWLERLQGLPTGLVLVSSSIDYRDSLRLMAESDVLLVIDAPFDSSVFLPSKLVDYLGAERPILAITPPGAAAELVRRLGGYVVSPGDDTAIAAILERIIADGRQSRRVPDRAVGAEYSAPVIAGQFDAIVAMAAESRRTDRKAHSRN